MKKYLLIPMLFIAALATASADCGGCAEEKSETECKKECSTEKSMCCGGEAPEGKSCCATEEEEHTHEEEAAE
jgi:hypothetical protein